ncbi:hypothetical protein BP5796_12321 [Coleophoma crateriformis]|uniref:NAD-dependent epimerase/dehydratase domain-containing protein n=1 Tax=Coleophoma crateriformis TaxID=565419 RepID=A0A3D8Q9E2_9HELO|nr:hypothetical protein BP5796_12321 [Coleophoma crateriformis]
MASDLVFVTGATGFIGAATAMAALKAGYRLRLSVRNEAQIAKLKGIFSEFADKIEYVVVPDIMVEGAFAKVLDGVTYILHLASPLARSTDKNKIFPPAVQGTVGILRDAAKIPSVKKVVIASSIAALVPITGVPEGEVVREDTNWDLSVDTNANFDAGNEFATAMKVYGASKLLANQASWEFMAKERPHFALVSIHPTLVYGHSLTQQSAKELEGSTNGILFSSIMQGPSSDGPLRCVYVGDVADALVKALNPSIKSGSKYLISGQRFTWKDTAEIVEKNFPGVPHKLPTDTNPKVSLVDTSKAEADLGIGWAAPEKIITEVLKQQLPYFS